MNITNPISFHQRIIAVAADLIVYSLIQFTLSGILQLVGLAFLAYPIAGIYLLCRDSLPFLHHQSIGKKFQKLKVVNKDGSDIDIITDIKRNFVFIPGLLGSLFFYIGSIATLILVAIEIYKLYKNEVRMGDSFAETTVISAE